jgi:hypothetical protein
MTHPNELMEGYERIIAVRATKQPVPASGSPRSGQHGRENRAKLTQ